MPFDPDFVPLAGLTIKLHIVKAKDLVAKDRGLLGRKKHSDPFIRIFVDGRKVGYTDTISQTIQPIWDQEFTYTFGAEQATQIVRNKQPIELAIFDKDKISFNDPMGVVKIPLDTVQEDEDGVWYEVEEGEGSHQCDNASGEVLVKAEIVAKSYVELSMGSSYQYVPSPRLRLGIAWATDNTKREKAGHNMDLACVGIRKNGTVTLNDLVHSGDTSSIGMSHTGNSLVSRKMYDQQRVRVNMGSVPRDVVALYLVLSVGPFDKENFLTGFEVTVGDSDTGMGVCRYRQGEDIPEGEGTQFLLRLSRNLEDDDGTWAVTPMGHFDDMSTNCGLVVPQIKAFTRDLLPDARCMIDPSSRLCILREDTPFRVKDFCGDEDFPNSVTMALEWDVKPQPRAIDADEKPIGKDEDEGEDDDDDDDKKDDDEEEEEDEERALPDNTDLDAHAICYGKSGNMVEVIDLNKTRNSNGSIKHMGDDGGEDEDDDDSKGNGDDERIKCYLLETPDTVHQIAFCITAKSGDTLDYVTKLAFRLLGKGARYEIAKYTIDEAGKEMGGHTGYLVGSFLRNDDKEDEEGWCFRILGAPMKGENLEEITDNIGEYLEYHEAATPKELKELTDEMLEECEMPEAEVVEEEPVECPVGEL